jgi:hypothetical protein
MQGLSEFIRCLDLNDPNDPKGGGAVNTSLESLTLEDVSVSPKIGNTLGEALPIFFSAEEIINIHEIAKTKPDIYDAVREEGAEAGSGDAETVGDIYTQGADKATEPCKCRNCKSKKDKKD